MGLDGVGDEIFTNHYMLKDEERLKGRHRCFLAPKRGGRVSKVYCGEGDPMYHQILARL